VSVSGDGGATFAAPVRIDRNTGAIPQIASDAHVAVDGSGSVYAVWRDNRNGTGDIYFNRSLDSGATWMVSDVRLDSGTAYSDHPRIAASSTGGVYVVWEDDRNGSVDIYTASSQNYGAAWGADIKLDTDVFDHDSLNPSIAALDPGWAWVVWEDYRDGLPDIRMSLTSDAGVSWSVTDIKVNADPPGTAGATRPDVAADAGGMVYVAWEDDRNGALDIYVNFSMDSGSTFQPIDLRADTDTAGAYDSQLPQLSAAGGRLHVVWLDYRNVEHYNGDIYYRLLL
jgi:hypothetical protein